MLKALGILLLAAFCLLTGLLLCARVHKRITALEHFIRLFTVMQTQIAYAMLPTDALLQNICRFSEFSDFSFVFFLQEAFIAGNPFSSAWKYALFEYAKHAALQASDTELLEAFGDVFGTTDKDGQTANCAYYISLLKERTSELKKSEKNSSRLYLSLGVFGGLFIMILLV
ncbi:MAG: stage III sporulation protein AB [Candidatus Fimenecus sp.]